MQNISGCKINVQPPFGRDIEREIQLVGSRNAIEQAKTVIMNKINSVVRMAPGLLLFPSANRGRNPKTVLLDFAVKKNIVIGTHRPNSFTHSRTLVRLLGRAPMTLTLMLSMAVIRTTSRCGMRLWPSSSIPSKSNNPTSPTHQGYRNTRHKIPPWANIHVAR